MLLKQVLAMSFWWCFLLTLSSNGYVSSFPANDIVNEPRTKSHSSITLEAIYKATATFLHREGLVNDTEQLPTLKVSNFFGTDGDSLRTFISTIREISGYMSDVKKDKASISLYHVNGEQIHNAHVVIKSLRNEVEKLSKNTTIVRNKITLIREKIAQILYIIQEFYSNTNWIELYGASVWEEFGQCNVLKIAISTLKENTCTNCESVNGVQQCTNNTFGTKLTSGYRSGQNVGKPLRQGYHGKCSHGTRDDTSRNLPATGGIYKGRSIQNEAPHSYLHEAAAEAAVNATEYYLIDKGKGLQQMIGADVFRDVFSIHTRAVETFPSSNVLITWFEMPTGLLNNTASILVDGYIETLKISIKPVAEVALYYPNGSSAPFISKNETSGIVLTLSVRDTEAGKWKIVINGTQSCVVNVTAQSALDFSIDVLNVTTDGNSYQLSGNPIKGKRYSLVVDIQNLNANSTCSSVVLLDESGHDEIEILVTKLPYIGFARYMGVFVPFNKSSFVQIRGTDELGNPFLRTRMLLIIPVSLQLHVMPLLGDLRLYQASNISFSLKNTGNTTVEFVVTISNDTTDVSVNGSLGSGEIYSGVALVIPQSLQTQLLNFNVTLKNHTEIIQSEKRRYSVSDTWTAHCTVTEYPTMCPLESLNTENCSAYNWTGSVEVSSATIQESEIRVSTDEVVLDHMNLTDANFSVVISISGHCCIQSFVLSITDKNNSFDQCQFDLSKQPLTVVRSPTTEIPTTVKESMNETEITTRKMKTTMPVVSMNYPTSDILTTVKDTMSANGTDEQNQDDNSAVIGMALGFSFLGLILVVFLVILFCKIIRHSNYKFPVVLAKYSTLNEGERKVLEVDVNLSGFQNPSYKNHSEGDEIISGDPQGSELENKIVEDKSIPLNSTVDDKGNLNSAACQNDAIDFKENDEKDPTETEQPKSTVCPSTDSISDTDQKPVTNTALEETIDIKTQQVLSDGPSPAEIAN